MFALFLAGLVLVAIVEITVSVQIGQALGFANMLGLMVLVSAIGVWLARHEGFVTWRRINASAARGEVPGNELIDGFLILLGGLMLLTPGFVTDLIALSVLFPPTRALYRNVVRRRFRLVGIQATPGRSGRVGHSDKGRDDIIDV